MYEAFEALPPEKSGRILSAALLDFGRYGYKKTSAGQLAENAGISKAMIFHYFGSKCGLYEYLFLYCAKFLSGYFSKLESELKGLDYISQVRFLTKIKLQAYTENPAVFAFITMVFIGPENAQISGKTKDLFASLKKLQAQTSGSMQKAPDDALFRDDLSIPRAKRYISWIFDGYSREIMEKLQGSIGGVALEPYWSEFDGLLADLEKLFYKKEGGN